MMFKIDFLCLILAHVHHLELKSLSVKHQSDANLKNLLQFFFWTQFYSKL